MDDWQGNFFVSKKLETTCAGGLVVTLLGFLVLVVVAWLEIKLGGGAP